MATPEDSVRPGITITDFSDRSAGPLTPEEVEQSLRLEASCLKGRDTATSTDGHKYHFLDAQPRVKLNSGFYMPLLGLGTWYITFMLIQHVSTVHAAC